ncbi:ferritin-like domain-containing protein [Lyophyllum atratum]|nr:ferritin-like domain-containing protein [Lyophyllum atratum]
MKLSAAFAQPVLTTTVVQALPSSITKRAEALDGNAVLNFALTMEHLENAFDIVGLAKYNEKAFTDAGFSPVVRGRFTQISQHEKMHVAFLSEALGDKATKPCQYSFPHNDALEGVGVTAYSGAARFITNKDCLTAAASVLATEARHASWITSAVNKFSGWSGDFHVPLSPNEVFIMAGAFITSCPSTNLVLPSKAFPTLSIAEAKAPPGSAITFKSDSSAVASGTKLFAVFFTGLSKIFLPLQDGKVTIPKDLIGTVYVAVGKIEIKADESDIVAGPTALRFEFDSQGKVIA